jgi:hypothetical protein
MQTTALTETRKPDLNDAIKFYQQMGKIRIAENTRETILRGHCPFPTHQRKGRQSFRVVVDINGRMLSCKCLSESCKPRRRFTQNDVIAFVSAIEGCSVIEASMMIRGGLLSGTLIPLSQLTTYQDVWPRG